MIRLLVARHGQSEWNAAGRWQGRADPPLSDIGMAQSRAAAGAVGSVDAVVASPLVRALVTATVISEATGVGPVLVEPGLQERDVGAFEGLTRNEIERQFPGYLANGRRPPGWEPDPEVALRALAALDSIVTMVGGGSGDTVVIAVSHAGIIYSLETRFGQEFLRIDNLNGRWFVRDRGHWSLGERVSLLPEGVAATEADGL